MIKTATKIKKLPEEVINKISAGEVINRPASVLKELIENSIDANASVIEVFLEEGGKRNITVIDNGEGIEPDELTLAVQRHTTSKINSFEDIYSIYSYGFRGEALHSISSVSKFSIISRKREYPLGKELYIEGGKIVSLTDTGSPIGTKVKVKDLFFNIPVRHKFLKSSKVEFKHSLDIFLKYSLAYPNISFKLFKDGKIYLNLEKSNLKNRIQSIYPQLKERLVKVFYENELGKIYGFLAIDESYKKSGFVYINNRPIKNKEIFKFIKGLIGEKFFCLFIELPSYYVDFNIHPSKEEVKFKKDKPVYELIREGLRNIQTFSLKKSYRLAQPTLQFKTDKIKPKIKFLGQLEDTFLLVYLDGDLYILDQHIVSERINFEILYREYIKNSHIKSKKLKRKVKLDISILELEKLKYIEKDLERLGFKFENKDEKLFLLEIPFYINTKEAKDILLDILNSEDITLPIEKIIGEIACSKSVKAGDILSNTEAQIILENWIRTDNPNLCPHGRPIYYKLSLNEVKKVLGRKG
ncbi:MAG: DNA mismatch repair endonuclease MutL [Persephonella sp.]|nr:MAG: DNA mismatch repair endonuclease MutL [Persephonella sp.]RUM62081.1 MAG: DNA mismatch repair endonuclease MutL [Persephonella sp.]